MDELAEINLNFLPDDPDGIYLVGGIVRDLLAGHPQADIDLVVAGNIDRAARQIAEKTGGSIIDLGKKGFDVLRVASPETTIDITPLEHPSIESDLRQRDFTINAMAYDVKARRLVDCTGGRVDMQQKKIRMVSPAAFEKDPARLVRAYRMASVLHYSIADETEAAIGTQLEQVRIHWRRAQEASAAGDWATWGRAIEELGAAIEAELDAELDAEQDAQP